MKARRVPSLIPPFLIQAAAIEHPIGDSIGDLISTISHVRIILVKRVGMRFRAVCFKVRDPQMAILRSVCSNVRQGYSNEGISVRGNSEREERFTRGVAHLQALENIFRVMSLPSLITLVRITIVSDFVLTGVTQLLTIMLFKDIIFQDIVFVIMVKV